MMPKKMCDAIYSFKSSKNLIENSKYNILFVPWTLLEGISSGMCVSEQSGLSVDHL